MDVAEPAFPRATAYWWFGCKSASKGTLGNIRWQGESPEESSLFSGMLDAGDRDSFDNDVSDIILDAGIIMPSKIRPNLSFASTHPQSSRLSLPIELISNI